MLSSKLLDAEKFMEAMKQKFLLSQQELHEKLVG